MDMGESLEEAVMVERVTIGVKWMQPEEGQLFLMWFSLLEVDAQNNFGWLRPKKLFLIEVNSSFSLRFDNHKPGWG